MGTVHGTCVAIDGLGVLLRGASGSGKSDLALRLIDAGALLVADDQVALELNSPRQTVTARPPAAIAGLLEVRGLGPMAVSSVSAAALGLVADLVPGGAVERLPEPAFCAYLGVRLPLVSVDPFRASAAAVLRVAARAAGQTDGAWPVHAEP